MMFSGYLFLLATYMAGLALAHTNLAQNLPTPEDYVAAHNAVRAEVGVGPIAWDDTVAAYAQDYANQRIEDCELLHSHGPYGENVAIGYGDFCDPVKLWVDEKPYYDYDSNSCVAGVDCLHYTQMVWRDSVRLGCGQVHCPNGCWFVSCNYDPPGNYMGQRPY